MSKKAAYVAVLELSLRVSSEKFGDIVLVYRLLANSKFLSFSYYKAMNN